MKKHKIFLVALVGCLLLGIILWQSQKSADRGVALQPRSAADQKQQPSGQPLADATKAESAQVAAPASNQIVLIDQDNPAYARPLSMLLSFYYDVFRTMPIGDQVSPDKLREAARLMSVVRLSQTMHDATIAKIAKIANGPMNSITIAIPSYEAEGAILRKYLDEKLPSEFKTPEIANFIQNDFIYFGRYSQSIEVVRDATFKSEPIYNITHLSGAGVGTSSTVPESRLGRYAPFEGWFPKS